MNNYIEVYDMLSEEQDIEKLRNMAKYLLVGRALNDPTISEEQAIALAEYAVMQFDEEEVTVHWLVKKISKRLNTITKT